MEMPTRGAKMSEETRKAAVFSCEYSEQNPVYCQQCGGHEHLCRKGGLGDEATQWAWMRYANEQGVPHDHEDEEAFKYGFDAGASSGNRKAKLEIAEEIENHSYLAGTHEMCVWIDGLTKRLREGGE